MARVLDEPTTEVNRLQLMKLLYRYKALLEWELSWLAQMDGETVSLLLPPAPGARKKMALMKADSKGTSPKDEDQKKDGGKEDTTAEATRLPGNLENSCLISIPTIEGYADLVEAATPYVAALAEE